jgi:hypothetical protein
MTFTLWAEGPSDTCLGPLLRWMLLQSGVDAEFNPDTDFCSGVKDHRSIIRFFERENYWSDLLFIHRDADSSRTEAIQERDDEITEKIKEVRQEYPNLPSHIVVIPVQETEAWLLASEKALRSVTGNTKDGVVLPGKSKLESIGDPAVRLCSVLRELGQSIGENKKVTWLWVKIMDAIGSVEPEKYGVLRGIPSFDRLESAVKKVVDEENLRER